MRFIFRFALIFAGGVASLVGPAHGVDQTAENVRLTKELTDLVASRRESISTLDIVAELVSPIGQALPNTPEQIRAVLDQYVGSSRSDSDRELMYRELFQARPQRQKPLAKTVRLVVDGPRLSVLQDHARSVTDERASILVSPREPGTLQVSMWKPGKARARLVDLSAFSWELDCPWLIPTQPYGIVTDDRGQFVLSWKDGGETHRTEVSGGDGILNRRLVARDDSLSVILQVGRISAPDGVPFPAVICKYFYQDGNLRSVSLLVPKAIKVNQPVDPGEFRIAVPAKTVITGGGDDGVSIALSTDVKDLVDFAMTNGINQD